MKSKYIVWNNHELSIKLGIFEEPQRLTAYKPETSKTVRICIGSAGRQAVQVPTRRGTVRITRESGVENLQEWVGEK